MRDWYNDPTQSSGGSGITWAKLLQFLPEIFIDLHTFFSVDVESGILSERSWPWLETRITAIVNKNGLLREALGLPNIPAF